MPIPLQIALTLGPLAVYFLVLGAWQSGRDGRVVGGAVDFGLLAFGIGGLVAFGPIGSALIRLLFPGPSVWAWLALPTSVALVAMLAAPRMHRRLVVYNADRRRVAWRGLAGALSALPKPALPLDPPPGFEDESSPRGLRLDVSPRSRTAVIEAFGDRPDILADLVAPRLRPRLRETGLRSSPIARLWLSLAALVIWLPLLVTLLARPRVRAALKAFAERMQGG